MKKNMAGTYSRSLVLLTILAGFCAVLVSCGGGGGGGEAAATGPKAPSGLTATAVSSVRIDLTWTDNSDDESGFRIERSADGTTFAEVATTSANIDAYSDSGLPVATSYYYRVCAFNSVGDSGYAGPSSATTRAAGITAFSFVLPNVNGTINENTGTISVTVPYGTDVSQLTAVFTTSGASVEVGSTVQTSGTTVNDFSAPVVYRVIASDSTSQTYTVTVSIALNDAKAITSFTILGRYGSVQGTTISVTVPFGTDLSALTPTIVMTGESISPASGAIQDFTAPVAYTVTAADGSSQVYLVTVTVDPDHVTVTVNPGNVTWIAGYSSSFGPQQFDVTAELVLANPVLACSPLSNNVAGKIVLVDRGSCTFTAKALYAQAAGGIGVIIVNNVVSATPPNMGGTDPTVTIPVASLTLSQGNDLKTLLASGTVTVRLTRQ